MIEKEFTSVNELRKSLIGEIVKSVGLPDTTFWLKIFSPIFWLPTRRLSLVGADFDRNVFRDGIQHAMQRLQAVFVNEVDVPRMPMVPKESPLLIVTNHPGTYDAVVVASQIPRDDLKIVSSDIPFIEKMRTANRHFLFATRDTFKRMVVIKNIVEHLSIGGSVLIFPGEHIEPEPAFMPEAMGELDKWSRAIEIFINKVPQTEILVGIVSNVLREENFQNILTKLRKQQRDKQRIGEFIQVINQLVYNRKYSNIPKISFADPFSVLDFPQQDNPDWLLPTIIQTAKKQMQLHLSI